MPHTGRPCSCTANIITVLLSFIFLFFRKDFLHGHELSHDILCTSRSDDNRRAAGAVDTSASGCHYEQTKSSVDCRPGGEAFVSTRVH